MKFSNFAGGLGCIAAMLTLTTTSLSAAPKQPVQQNAPANEIPPVEKKFPTGGRFELRSINGKPVPGNIFVTFTVDASSRGTGSSGCNSWSATVIPVRGQRLAVGPLAMTKKTCDKDTMAVEHVVTGIIHASPFWDVEGSELTLKLPNGQLKFQRSL